MATFINRDEFVTLVNANQYNRHWAIMRAACELFIMNNDPTREEELHFEELFLRLLPKLDLQTKIEVAERLCRCEFLPRTIALTLAKDDISVAVPILKNYPNFSDNDLLVIIAHGNALHAHALASRQHLSDKVILALSHLKLSLPDHDLICKDSDNNKNEDETRDIEPRHEDLIGEVEYQRTEPQNVLRYLDSFLEADHAFILTQMQIIEDTAKTRKLDAASILKQAHKRAGKITYFLQLARSRDVDGFADLLAKECALNTMQTVHIIADTKGFALAICLKSLALPSQLANEAFILLNPELGRNTDQVFLLSWFYNQITPAGARSLVEQWQPAVQQSRPAYQSVHDGETLSLARSYRSKANSKKTSGRRARKRTASNR